MPGFTCCVPGCYNNSHRDKALHFYTFPKDEELRRLWLKNVSRAGVSGCFSTFQPTTGHRVCSEHFQGGRKSYLVRVPTIFPCAAVNERKAQRARRPRPAAAAAVRRRPRRAPAAAAEAPAGGAAEDVKPIDLTVQVELGAAATIGPSPVRLPVPVPAAAAAGEESPVEGGPPDHSYSLSSGTTSEELLRKLNEQRDIIALLEVREGEMKGSIRRLRWPEAQLREEIREKDRLLHAASAGTRKRHGL
ncbi:LOW QUALITY PROTEIN: THAP domain-containing protein 11 [Geothlypis trichas]